MSSILRLAVVAIGGNSLITDKAHLSIPDQYAAAATTCGQIVDMIEAGWNVLLTHGNGPQVGFSMRRSELSIDELPPVPMDYAGADIQGALGYMFARALRNEFRRRGIARQPVAIVTQTLVDKDDPAFGNPIKPIGSYFTEAQAHKHRVDQGWHIHEDAGRGWRRVVPSPLPQRVIELEQIRFLLRAGYLVIACGGGGIPVIENDQGDLVGVEAVIDKDLASSLLARQLGAQLLMISTAVEKLALDFNTPQQRWVDHLDLAQAKELFSQNQFDPGSMGPKIRAIIEFLEAGGERSVITNPQNIGRALSGQTGTHSARA